MKLLNRQSGLALIIVLIVLALGSLLLVPLLWQVSSNLKYHQLIERKTVEAYSADSGLQYALCEIYNNPGQYTDSRLQASFTLNATTVNVTAEYQGRGVYKLTSTATSPSGRSTTIESYVSLSVGIFAFAIATKQDMNIQNVTVDSSPEQGEGNIHSNRNIFLENCEIKGDATAVDQIYGWEESVSGVVTQGSSSVPFPPDYAELYQSMAKAGDEHPGDLTIRHNRPLGPLYISGNLTVISANVTLEGTMYVTGGITVEGGHLDGEEIVVAEGNIVIEGGGYGSEYIPIVISTSGDIRLEKPAVDAVIYAPNGRVYLEEVHLYGAVAGNSVTVEQWSIITYAKQLQGREDVPGGELHTITYRFM